MESIRAELGHVDSGVPLPKAFVEPLPPATHIRAILPLRSDIGIKLKMSCQDHSTPVVRFKEHRKASFADNIMANPAIQGPGMLWVTARISAKDILDEPTYMKWYDEDHIAEIVSTSGVNSAFRYIDVDRDSPTVKWPYLAFYPMSDLKFTQGDEFRRIRVKSDLLPGSGIVYDLADNEVRYLGLVGQTDAKSKTVSAVEPAEGTSNEDVTKFFDQQIAKVSKTAGYLRTLRFRLVYARTNAQSRALKGLPTTDEPAPEPPTWQVVHEFTTEPASTARISLKSDPNEVLRQAKQVEFQVYKLAKVHGEGKSFE